MPSEKTDAGGGRERGRGREREKERETQAGRQPILCFAHRMSDVTGWTDARATEEQREFAYAKGEGAAEVVRLVSRSTQDSRRSSRRGGEEERRRRWRQRRWRRRSRETRAVVVVLALYPLRIIKQKVFPF